MIQYIRNQAEHHRVRGFKEEYVEFLKKHQIEYDESICGTDQRWYRTFRALIRRFNLYLSRPDGWGYILTVRVLSKAN